MTTALILSSASVRRQEDKRKQSLSRLLGRSSASPVNALSLQLTTPSSRKIQSAGIESPDYNDHHKRRGKKREGGRDGTWRIMISPTTRSIGLILSMTPSLRTEHRSSR